MINTKISESNINKLFERLVSLLENEQPLYAELLQVLRIKQKAIIDGDLMTINECVSHEYTLNEHIQAAVQDRALQASVLGTILGIEKDRLGLKAIAEKAPENFVGQITELRDDMANTLDQITRTNHENRYLLNSSIEYVKGMVKLLLKASEEQPNLYSRRGTVDGYSHHYRVLNYQA